jgi:hypothetical protein
VRRLLTVLLAATLIVGACGDDSSNADPQLVASLRSRISESPQAQGDSTFGMTDDDITCFAEGLIAELGAAKIESGVDLSFDAFMATLSAGERRAVVDVMLGCVDVAEVLVAQISGEGSLSAESARCVVDGMLASDEFRDAVGESFVSGDSTFESDTVVAAILPVFLECLTPEELANLGNS